MKQQRQPVDVRSASSPKKKNDEKKKQLVVQQGGRTIRLSLTTLVATFLVASGLAFYMGRWTRLILDPAVQVSSSGAAAARHDYQHAAFGGHQQQQHPIFSSLSFSSGRANSNGEKEEIRQSKEKQKSTFSSAKKNEKNIGTAATNGNPVGAYYNATSRSRLLQEYFPHLNGSAFVEESRNFNQNRFSKKNRGESLRSTIDQESSSSLLYHEALVHPAMLAHRNPRRVAMIIIDSSSTSNISETVHQVVKHNTLEHLTVIRHGSRENASSCLPLLVDDVDDRVELITENAVDWFTRRFSLSNSNSDTEKFDVIIIDSFSKDQHYHHASALFSNNESSMSFAKALGNALTDQGVLVAHVGPADQPRDAALTHNPRRHERLAMTRALEELGGELGVLESLKIYSTYSESSSSLSSSSSSSMRLFPAGWTFMVAFRDYTTLTRWFANQAEIDLELEARIVSAGSSSLQHFDGATMASYQYPSRITEDIFCRTTTDVDLCGNGHGFDPQVPNAPISSFEVKPSQIQGAGRGIYLTESVQQGMYIAIDQGVHSLFVMPSAHKLISDMEDKTGGAVGDLWKPPLFYMHGYGFDTEYFGSDATVVDPGILTFANHGCNNTYNMGKVLSVTEMTADMHQPPSEVLLEDWGRTICDPFHDRSHWIYESASDQFRNDVQAGTELLDNYLPFYVDWEEGVSDLRSQCEGQTVGLVTAYEAADAEP